MQKVHLWTFPSLLHTPSLFFRNLKVSNPGDANLKKVSSPGDASLNEVSSLGDANLKVSSPGDTSLNEVSSPGDANLKVSSTGGANLERIHGIFNLFIFHRSRSRRSVRFMCIEIDDAKQNI